MLGRHADLREIHQELAAVLAVDDDTGRRWAAAEEDLERRLSVAVPGAATMLDQARARGDQIVFVSDTPHSEDFVAELLHAQGLSRPDEPVFTSSTREVSKSDGGLFHLVAAQLGHANAYVHTWGQRGERPRRPSGWRAGTADP